MGMTIDEAERYLKLMLGGMKYAVSYWKDRDKEESDIEQTNVEAVKTALDTMRKYQKIEQILKEPCIVPEGCYPMLRRIERVVEDEKDYETHLKDDLLDMLDKIRAEIVDLGQRTMNDNRASGIWACRDIIDKYKTKSEEEK